MWVGSKERTSQYDEPQTKHVIYTFTGHFISCTSLTVTTQYIYACKHGPKNQNEQQNDELLARGMVAGARQADLNTSGSAENVPTVI